MVVKFSYIALPEIIDNLDLSKHVLDPAFIQLFTPSVSTMYDASYWFSAG